MPDMNSLLKIQNAGSTQARPIHNSFASKSMFWPQGQSGLFS